MAVILKPAMFDNFKGERINQLMSLKCGAFIARKFDLKSMVR
jgi:hypothetical protein